MRATALLSLTFALLMAPAPGISSTWGPGKYSGLESDQPADGPAMPPEVNEDLAMSSLQAINRAEEAYAKTYNLGFTRDMEPLGPPPSWYHATEDHAGLFGPTGGLVPKSEHTSEFNDSGYRFTYNSDDPGTDGRVAGYAIIARPISFGITGSRNFSMNEEGVVHAIAEDRPATNADRPVGAALEK